MSDRKNIRIFSLNIQHGWNHATTVPPVFITKKRLHSNLDNIAALIRTHDSDIVLLQEVDKISPMTHNIDELEYLKDKAGLAHAAYGPSSEIRLDNEVVYSAGCGILSRYPLHTIESVKFRHSFPTPRKGFLCAAVTISPETEITVVSVHMVVMDILKSGSRATQIERMVERLAHKKHMVVGGDLNISMKSKHLPSLMTKLNIQTHEHAANHPHLHTHPSIRPRRRIDWIFASPDLHIADYQTFPDRVSDHLAVGTTVQI